VPQAAEEVAMAMSEKARDELDPDEFAFPRERKLPIHDAAHVRNAVARFDQVEGVSDSERDQAWKRLQSAATKHGVELEGVELEGARQARVLIRRSIGRLGVHTRSGR